MGFFTLEMVIIYVLMMKLSQSARILVVHPTNARSHFIITKPLIEELATRGHDITVFTSFPYSESVNLHQVDVSYLFPKVVNNVSLNIIQEEMPNPYKMVKFATDVEILMCEKLYPEEIFQKLLVSDEKFDLVMLESYAAHCLIPFAHRFKAPLITFVTSSAFPWTSEMVGLPDNPSYIPNYLLDYSHDMTFIQRIHNTVVLAFAKLFHKYYSLPRTQAIANEYFGDSIPPIDTLLKNTSLIFLNSHISISGSRPFPPNVVEIGGIHLERSSSKSIDKELKDILDQSSKGVLLVSFGSLVRTSSIPQEIIRKFLKAFSTLDLIVIFKYEDHLQDVPPNVVIRKWLPQHQMIEHKNVKVVMAHGGLASTIESVYFGKPLIGIPFFADQYLNVKSIVRQGAGVMLNFDSISDQDIEQAIKDVLTNPKYKENMKRLSLQFRDRPMTALQTAVFWTEYVIRHRGAPHLKPASVHLPFYQYMLLDVVAVLVTPLLLLLYITYLLFFKAVEVSPNDEKNYKLKKES